MGALLFLEAHQRGIRLPVRAILLALAGVIVWIVDITIGFVYMTGGTFLLVLQDFLLLNGL